jgi:hypothetical protein
MALVAVIALTMVEPDDPDPKGPLALIFGVVGLYMLLLFFFQSRDLSRAEAADARASTLKPEEIENPATLDESSLWAAMAVRPIDADAIRARKAIWSTTRGSMRLGMLITALIFLSVPPIYLLDTFVPLMIGAPLIAGIALWKSSRLLASGGELDEAYEESGKAMAPLGLELVERPEVVIEPKSVAPFRMGPGFRGALVMEGERHGRRVHVRMPAGRGVRTHSEVFVTGAAREFEFKARDGRLKAEAGAPPSAAARLKAVPNSPRWNGVRGHAGPDGIVVERKSVTGTDWLLDLWLAEQLADAIA